MQRVSFYQLNAIQALRFLAVLMVFFSHLGFLENNDSPLVRNIYKNVFSEGYLGVTFFFILSGFILTHSYEVRITKKKVDYFDFLIARIARVFPTHILTLLISLPSLINLWVSYGLFSIAIFGMNAFLLQSFIPSRSVFYSFNAPSWCLSALLFFYIIFPFLAVLRTSKLLMIAVFVLGYQLFVIGFIGTNRLYDASEQFYIFQFLIYVFPLSRLIDFVVGIILYRFFCSTRRCSVIYSTLFQILAVLIFCGFFVYHQSIPYYYRFDLYYLIPLSLVIIAFAYENGYLARIIDKNGLVFLGSASFAFYMIHQIVIRYYVYVHKYLLERSFITDSIGILSALACFIISLLASIYLYKYFEIKANSKSLSTLSSIKKKYGY